LGYATWRPANAQQLPEALNHGEQAAGLASLKPMAKLELACLMNCFMLE
jgi:hypothetical protein